MEQYTQTGFLIACVLGLSSFAYWLIRKIIKITTETVKENSVAFQELKFAIKELRTTIQDNNSSVRELRETIINKL